MTEEPTDKEAEEVEEEPKKDKKKSKDPTPKTFKQEIILWVFRSLLALVAGGVASGATYLVSCGSEYAKQKASIRAKRVEVRQQQRQLQLGLLKEIIEVAKKADFKDPTSLYQLGLISIMVNENEDKFGVRMNAAEIVLQQMFLQLSPINGLKKRLAESIALLEEIRTKLAEATTVEKRAFATVEQSYKRLNDPSTPAWKKRKLQEDITAAEGVLKEQRLIKQFYLQQQKREEQTQEYFGDQLDEQERSLKQSLRNAELTQAQLKNNSDEFLTLTNKLEKEGTHARIMADKLRVALKNLTRSSLQTDYTIVRLKGELEVREQELKTLRKLMYELLEKMKELKDCQPEDKQKADSTPAPAPKPVTAPPRPVTTAPPKPRAVGGGGGTGSGFGGGGGSLQSSMNFKPSFRVIKREGRPGRKVQSSLQGLP